MPKFKINDTDRKILKALQENARISNVELANTVGLSPSPCLRRVKILENEGVYRILIDNFNYEDTRKAVAMIGEKCLTESSGGITLETARKYAECGVDYISSGALTHSVHNMDLSLKAV